MFEGLFYFYFSSLSRVATQCCDHLTASDLLSASRVQLQPGDSVVKFETSLPGHLILKKYQEMRDTHGQNSTFNINVSKEELLQMAHQASKTSYMIV